MKNIFFPLRPKKTLSESEKARQRRQELRAISQSRRQAKKKGTSADKKPKKKIGLMKVFYALLAVSLCGLAVFFYFFQQEKKEKKIYTIAANMSLSGPSQVEGREALNAVQLFVDDLNDAGGIDGNRVEVIIFDDRDDKEFAYQNALKIAESENILLVLGHIHSAPSLAAAEVYKEAGIPAITASSTADALTLENDWYFRTLSNNTFQAVFIANYISKVLKKKSVSIVHDMGAYSLPLANSFEEEAKELGMEIHYKLGFDPESPEMEKTMTEIIAEMKEGDPGEIIFLSTYPWYGMKIISSLMSSDNDYTFFGSDTFGGSGFIKVLNTYPQERGKPGYYSDKMLTVSPFIVDIAKQEAQVFRNRYFAKFRQEPSWYAARYYDAVKVAVKVLRDVNPEAIPETLAQDRKSIRDTLSGIQFVEDAVEGINGPVFFDINGDAVSPWNVGIYYDQKLISYLFQCQPTMNLVRVDNVIKEILEERILVINKALMDKIQVVYTGMDINEVGELNLKDATYEVDFYLWFRFQGEFEDTHIEFVNSVDPIDLGEPIMERSFEDTTTRAYRVKAYFKSEFFFHEYPFDEQILRIQFRHKEHEKNQLIYVSDILGIRQVFNRAELDKTENIEAPVNLGGWDTEQVLFYQDTISNDSTLGMPEFFEASTGIEFSQFNAIVEIKRKVISFIFKNLFPLILLLVVTYIVYYMPASFVETRVSIGMGTMLSSAFFHLQVSENLGVNYLMAIEYFFFSVYFLASLVIIISMINFFLNQRLNRTEDEAEQSKITRHMRRAEFIGRIMHPTTMITVSTLIVVNYG